MAIAVVLCLLCPPASAQSVRYHGFQLDETYRLVLAEEDGWISIGLLKRIRPVGGRPLPGTRDETQGEGGRYMDADFLLRVRSEVVAPAAPNYFQNPGQRYRLYVQGLSVEPDYAAIVEVDASNARETLTREMERFRKRTTGINDAAIWNAEVLVLEILKEADRLPAHIAESVKRSKSGRFRITEGTQERRRVSPGQTWAPQTTIDRPVAGATIRSRKRDELPKGAVSWKEVRAPTAPTRPAAPETPAAAARSRDASRVEPPRIAQPRPNEARNTEGLVRAPDDARYTGMQTQSKTWELMGNSLSPEAGELSD
jgi:hypothetical protein